MNTAKIYHDSEGNECSIYQAVKREPEWAASRIQAGEEAIAKLEAMKAPTDSGIGSLDLLCGEFNNGEIDMITLVWGAWNEGLMSQT